MILQSRISSILMKIFLALFVVFIIGAVVSYFATDVPHFFVLCLMGAFWCFFGYYWNGKFVGDKNEKFKRC
jgi:hypothetical protein